jgi:hypothetical protein
MRRTPPHAPHVRDSVVTPHDNTHAPTTMERRLAATTQPAAAPDASSIGGSSLRQTESREQRVLHATSTHRGSSARSKKSKTTGAPQLVGHPILACISLMGSRCAKHPVHRRRPVFKAILTSAAPPTLGKHRTTRYRDKLK